MKRRDFMKSLGVLAAAVPVLSHSKTAASAAAGAPLRHCDMRQWRAARMLLDDIAEYQAEYAAPYVHMYCGPNAAKAVKKYFGREARLPYDRLSGFNQNPQEDGLLFRHAWGSIDIIEQPKNDWLLGLYEKIGLEKYELSEGEYFIIKLDGLTLSAVVYFMDRATAYRAHQINFETQMLFGEALFK